MIKNSLSLYFCDDVLHINYVWSFIQLKKVSGICAISGQTAIGIHNCNQKLMNRVAEYECSMDIKRSQGQGQGQGQWQGQGKGKSQIQWNSRITSIRYKT